MNVQLNLRDYYAVKRWAKENVPPLGIGNRAFDQKLEDAVVHVRRDVIKGRCLAADEMLASVIRNIWINEYSKLGSKTRSWRT